MKYEEACLNAYVSVPEARAGIGRYFACCNADAAQRRGAGRLVYEALVDTLTVQGFTQAVARIALPS